VSRTARWQATLGGIGLLVGVLGFLAAGSRSFTAAYGRQFTFDKADRYELRLMTFNRLGALVLIVLAGLGLLAARSRRPAPALVAAAGFAVSALLVVVQWRDGQSSNLLGASGTNLGFSLTMALGFAVTAYAVRFDAP